MVLNKNIYIPTSTNTLYYIYMYIIIYYFYYTYYKINAIFILYPIGECVDRLIDILCTCITWWTLEQTIKCRQNEVEREMVEREGIERW